MKDIQVGSVHALRDYYRHFADVEAAPVSPLYADWARSAADDDEIIRLIMQLPEGKRQPNLVFAAARVHGLPHEEWQRVRPYLVDHWTQIAATARARRTQTNEAGRLAVLNLAFSRITEQAERPLALIEVGTSAGLCLYPDAWPVAYTSTDGDVTHLTPCGQLRSSVGLRCELRGIDPPEQLPRVAWRAGIDINPLDLTDSSDREWLEALVWPGMEYRLERITAGTELIQRDAPRLFTGDLNEKLPEVLAEVPAGTLPVVFHSAVLVYLQPEERARFVQQMSRPDIHWVSNEGLSIFPELAARLPREDPEASGFILSLNGEPLARTGPHGQYLHALHA